MDKAKSDSPCTFPASRGCQSVDTLSIRPDERTTAIVVSMIGNPEASQGERPALLEESYLSSLHPDSNVT